MPFKSSAQQRLCIDKSMNDIGEGRKPKWNCEKYMCDGGSNSPTCKRIRSGGAIGSKIHEGPRGGLYFDIDGKKYYISEKNRPAMIKKFGIEKRAVRLSPYRSSSPKSKGRGKGKGRKSPKSPRGRGNKK